MDIKELDLIRQEINKIDDEIIELFKIRMQAVRQVANFKIKNNMEVLDTNREGFILNKYTSDIKEDDIKKEVTEFIQAILKISRDAQCEIINKNEKG
ncbi:MAG: chorismate mutase [Solirubrobacterales bacterium]